MASKRKTFSLGFRLHYPITIVKLLKKAGDAVSKQEALLRYSFKTTKQSGDARTGEVWTEVITSMGEWSSPTEGTIERFLVKEGDEYTSSTDCVEVAESCSHEIQFAGLCGMCGSDVSGKDWAAETRDTDRARISMVHDQTNLLVSSDLAEDTEKKLQVRLLRSRKLSLVADLDQTIIHAAIEPTIGEWQKDPSNPNHEAVKDVQAFQLNDDGPRGLASGCWYYIKLRPGLRDFLRTMSDMYEMHVYTMGTRAYALNIAKLVDPKQELFGNRIISRDENGSMTAKSLQRLFPNSTNMVAIIDDRADVWPRDRANLIKVMPYDFFKGIGDINSSFLPERRDLLNADPAKETGKTGKTDKTDKTDKTKRPAASTDATTNGCEEDATETMAAGKKATITPARTAGGDDTLLSEEQLEAQARTLEKQIKDRPLLHLQEKLDKEGEEADKTDTNGIQNGDAPTSRRPSQHRHLLLDDDRELSHVEKHLTNLHRQFYELYDRNTARTGGGRSSLGPDTVPDVGEVLSSIKAKSLRGVTVALTGIIPTNVDVTRSEIGLQLLSLGAEVRRKVSRELTHLVVSTLRPSTSKLRQAARIKSIKIVTQEWLAECLSQWTVVDETRFRFNVHPDDRPGGKNSVLTDTETETGLVSDEDEAEVEEATADASSPGRIVRLKRPKLGLGTAVRKPDDDDDDDDDDDSASDEDGEDDEDGVMPDDIQEGQLSPIDELKTFNWGSVNEELEEFLGSDDSDSDSDPDSDDEDEDGDGDALDEDGESGLADPSSVSHKRKHMPDEDSSFVERDTGDDANPKRQRVDTARVDEDSNMPTPQITGDEGDKGTVVEDDDEEEKEEEEEEEEDGSGGDEDFDDADLEAEFMAEFRLEEALDKEKG